jgi:hypothetical protein
MKVMHDPGNFLPNGDAAHREATPQELDEIKNQIHRGLVHGALAVGMGINYTAAASHEEIVTYSAWQWRKTPACMCIFATQA